MVEMKKIKTVYEKRPPCFGEMYALGEEFMASNCLGCRHFHDCEKRSDPAIETAVPLPPPEPDTYGELHVKW